MEAKDIAVWQRDLGDDIPGGSRPATAGTAKVRDDVQESGMRRAHRDESAQQDKVLYPS